MNKVLRFSLMAVLAIMGFGNALAEKEVVFDFNALDIATSHGANADEGIEASNAGDITTTWTTTIDGVTVSVSPKEEGKTNENRFWETKNGPQLRAYSGTITISAGESMTGIAFTSSTNKFNLTTTTGTLDGKKWSGEASEVVFTVAGNTQLDKITITIGGSATPPEPTGDNITVAKALEIIDALEDGAKTNDEYTVKGYVVTVTEINTGYGNATFTIADEKGGSSTLTIFRCKGFDGANITNSELLKVDDLVEVKGLLQKYVKDGTMTPEMAQGGKIISINGKTSDDAPNPEDAITSGLDASSPMTVDQALAYINDFSNGFTTTKKYYVTGTVSSITEINTANGNATFNLGDILCYRLKGLEGNAITDENYLTGGEAVVVYAKLQKYEKNGDVTPELSGGNIYSINGRTTDGSGPGPGPGTLVGDGSQSNPYTVGDLKLMTEDQYPTESVWVKGVIIGSAKSGTALNDEDVSSNIAIAETASSTDFAPVNLANNTDFRTKLNVVDNPGNKGQEVLLEGTILKYFGVTGVKNLVTAIFNGETISGITTVTADQLKNAPAYNLKGQRVNQGYKGLIIKGGMKLIQR